MGKMLAPNIVKIGRTAIQNKTTLKLLGKIQLDEFLVLGTHINYALSKLSFSLYTVKFNCQRKT